MTLDASLVDASQSAVDATTIDASSVTDASTAADAQADMTQAADASASVDAAADAATGEGSGNVCGGLLSPPCPEGEFCAWASGDYCGAADATGFCRTVADGVARRHCSTAQQACSCEGALFASECDAWAHGESIANLGPCDF